MVAMEAAVAEAVGAAEVVAEVAEVAEVAVEVVGATGAVAMGVGPAVATAPTAMATRAGPPPVAAAPMAKRAMTTAPTRPAKLGMTTVPTPLARWATTVEVPDTGTRRPQRRGHSPRDGGQAAMGQRQRVAALIRRCSTPLAGAGCWGALGGGNERRVLAWAN